jgi:ubiquitin-like 1-activating enzyme E1 A
MPPADNADTGQPEATSSAADLGMNGNITSVADTSMPGFMPMDNDINLNGYPQMAATTFAPETMSVNGLQPDMFPMPVQPPASISAAEIALYDRQIRLWGMQVQEKLRNANVLLIGIKGLGTEIAKNLVLAGIGVLTVLDHEVVSEEDLGAQFFVNETKVGQNRAEAALPEIQKLNPRVEIYSDVQPAVMKDPEYFQSFDVTIATGLILDVLKTINIACRTYGRKFYAADTHGMYGYVFADLVLHNYVIEREQSNKPAQVGDIESSTKSVVGIETKKDGAKMKEVIAYQEIYSPLPLSNLSPLPSRMRNTRRSRMKVTPLLTCLRALFDFQTAQGGRLPSHARPDLELFTRLANEKHLELSLPQESLRAEFLRSFLQNLGSELSPVVAYLGGYIAQDVINVVGQNQPALQNWLFFDGEDFTATQCSLHPINDDAMNAITTNGDTTMTGGMATNGAIAVE